MNVVNWLGKIWIVISRLIYVVKLLCRWIQRSNYIMYIFRVSEWYSECIASHFESVLYKVPVQKILLRLVMNFHIAQSICGNLIWTKFWRLLAASNLIFYVHRFCTFPPDEELQILVAATDVTYFQYHY